jgi:hypothetical protein
MSPRAVVWLLCGLAACGGGREARRAQNRAARQEVSFTGSLSAKPTPEAFAVAEVNEDTIWDVDVARYAREHQLDARTALDELVDLTLLAQEAHRRGYADDPEVVEARARERVRVLVERDYAPSFDGPEDVPMSDLERAWKRRDIYLFYNHAEYHRVAWARVGVKKKSGEDVWAAARPVAEELRQAIIAAKPTDKLSFGLAAKAWADAHPGVKVTISDFAATTGRETDASFAKLAFSLNKVGELSEVGRTPWGWDVLYLYEIIPEASLSLEQAAPEMRTKLFESSQKTGFLRWVDALVAAHQVVRHDERLDQVTVDTATALP